MLKINNDSKVKSVVLDMDSIPDIERIAKEENRNFSGQIRHIISLYLKDKNNIEKLANSN